MMYTFWSIWIYLFLMSFFGILIVLALNFLNIKLLNSKFLAVCIDIVAYVAVTLFVISTFIFFGYILFAVHFLLYRVVFLLMDYCTGNSGISNYIAITSVLIILAYTPHSFGTSVLKFLSKVTGNKVSYAGMFKPFAAFFRFKLMIYLIAFLLVFVSSLEMISQSSLINNDYWLDISPYINQAVLTFIAFDRFIKLFLDQWEGMTKQIKEIKKSIYDFYKRGA